MPFKGLKTLVTHMVDWAIVLIPSILIFIHVLLAVEVTLLLRTYPQQHQGQTSRNTTSVTQQVTQRPTTTGSVRYLKSVQASSVKKPDDKESKDGIVA